MDQMQDMGQMHGHAMMLLPPWLAVVLGVVSLLVVVPHITHVAVTAGQHRWWHVGHIAMSIGMAQMYLFGLGNPFVVGAFRGLFIAITCLMLAAAVWCRAREGAVNPLWVATAVDTAAMAYMYAPASARPEPVTVLLIVYLVAQAIAWASGAWAKVPAFDVDAPSTATSAGANAVRRAYIGPADSTGNNAPARAAVTVVPRPRLGLSGRKDPRVRATLAIMALSMAYMLLAMI